MTVSSWENEQRLKVLQELHPFKGTGKPDDIARAAVFLASKDNTWMTGSLMTVDGGYVAR